MQKDCVVDVLVTYKKDSDVRDDEGKKKKETGRMNI